MYSIEIRVILQVILEGVYKSIVKEKVLQILVSQEGENSFDSCISILNAYFNSLLAEPEEMFEFFH